MRYLTTEEADEVYEVHQDFRKAFDQLVVEHANKLETIEQKQRLIRCVQDDAAYLGYRMGMTEEGKVFLK